MPALIPTTMPAEDTRDPRWRSRAGLPLRWMDFDGDRTITSPPAPGASFTVGYLAAPVAMAAPGSFPDSRIPDMHQEHLPLAALYLLLSKDADTKNPAGANKSLSDFYQLIGVTKPGGK